MPKYQTKAQRQKRYEILARSEGEECLVCRMEKGKRVGPPSRKLVIEHADNDKTNWDWDNIHLACYSCNKKMEQWPVRVKKQKLQAYGDQREKERERENLPTRKTVLKDEVDYSTASTEIQLNRIYHTKWMNYVHQRVEEEGAPNKNALVSAAAKVSGCSLQISKNYMTVEVSDAPNSILKESYDGDGNKVIVFRDNNNAPAKLK